MQLYPADFMSAALRSKDRQERKDVFKRKQSESVSLFLERDERTARQKEAARFI